MKTATTVVAQGDVLFRRVESVPKGAAKIKRKGALIVAHSETGHHHVIDDLKVAYFEVPGNPLVGYLQLGDLIDGGAGGVDVVHQRPWDTHETIRLLGKLGDVWEVRRQREMTPEGWARVQD
jgi:hypothetical protein